MTLLKSETQRRFKMNLVNKANVFVAILSILLFAGCLSTVVPPTVKPVAPSFDAGERNSGFYGWATNNGVAYGIISQRAKERYNNLIQVYGEKFNPPISKNFGIIDNVSNNWISLEALSDFATMNRWRKNEIKQ